MRAPRARGHRAGSAAIAIVAVLAIVAVMGFISSSLSQSGQNETPDDIDYEDESDILDPNDGEGEGGELPPTAPDFGASLERIDEDSIDVSVYASDDTTSAAGVELCFTIVEDNGNEWSPDDIESYIIEASVEGQEETTNPSSRLVELDYSGIIREYVRPASDNAEEYCYHISVTAKRGDAEVAVFEMENFRFWHKDVTAEELVPVDMIEGSRVNGYNGAGFDSVIENASFVFESTAPGRACYKVAVEVGDTERYEGVAAYVNEEYVLFYDQEINPEDLTSGVKFYVMTGTDESLELASEGATDATTTPEA